MNVLTAYCVNVSKHKNDHIVVYAINSSKQQFQNKILAPFLQFMQKLDEYGIKLLVVKCAYRIIKARCNNVKSCCKYIFDYFNCCKRSI